MFREPRSNLPKWFVDPRVELKESPIHGVGCFAKEDIEVNTLIESCPVIVFHTDTLDMLADACGDRHILMEYPFQWDSGQCAIVLGYGGIYNHSTTSPSVTWRPNLETPSMEYWTREAVAKGEELFVRYYPFNKSGQIWFPDEDADRMDGKLTPIDPWADTRLLTDQVGPYGKHYKEKMLSRNRDSLGSEMKRLNRNKEED